MKFWKTVLVIGLPTIILQFGLRLIFDDFSAGLVVSAIINGILFGITFTWFSEWFAKRQMKNIEVELQDGEDMLKEGGANHILKYEGVGGKLALTNHRLVFKSHKLNVQTHQLNIPLNQIESLSIDKSLVFLKNVLFVTFNGKKHKFIVNEPDEWVTTIIERNSLPVTT
ncbi:GRAM domain-containing protein [Pseudochryseolinea flava]|uniref:GRAM domain-containing protein n=1 Tax=Pseudochryseolinea flava TaxID=2059302 RepID=A0A364Y9S5_9BACT|nr:GRAM domain-containing protein [Pseudochryseolinea flava]RAW03195.1 hypothetical protein DQQ10_03660 [Pseudochryseolinea flava]